MLIYQLFLATFRLGDLGDSTLFIHPIALAKALHHRQPPTAIDSPLALSPITAGVVPNAVQLHATTSPVALAAPISSLTETQDHSGRAIDSPTNHDPRH